MQLLGARVLTSGIPGSSPQTRCRPRTLVGGKRASPAVFTWMPNGLERHRLRLEVRYFKL
jgi:hypothetical protein